MTDREEIDALRNLLNEQIEKTKDIAELSAFLISHFKDEAAESRYNNPKEYSPCKIAIDILKRLSRF